jgi:hypothetical protein
VEAGCEIEDCVQDTMKRHISPKVAFQDPREFVSYKDAKECGGERRKRVQSKIIWVTQGRLMEWRMCYIVLRESPFCLWNWFDFCENHVVCNFCSGIRKRL